MKKINTIFDQESEQLHSTYIVDGIRFTYAQYDARKPGIFKVETIKDILPLIQKIYCCADITEHRKKEIFSYKDIQKVGNNVNYKNDHDVNLIMIQY